MAFLLCCSKKKNFPKQTQPSPPEPTLASAPPSYSSNPSAVSELKRVPSLRRQKKERDSLATSEDVERMYREGLELQVLDEAERRRRRLGDIEEQEEGKNGRLGVGEEEARSDGSLTMRGTYDLEGLSVKPSIHADMPKTGDVPVNRSLSNTLTGVRLPLKREGSLRRAFSSWQPSVQTPLVKPLIDEVQTLPTSKSSDGKLIRPPTTPFPTISQGTVPEEVLEAYGTRNSILKENTADNEDEDLSHPPPTPRLSLCRLPSFGTTINEDLDTHSLPAFEEPRQLNRQSFISRSISAATRKRPSIMRRTRSDEFLMQGRHKPSTQNSEGPVPQTIELEDESLQEVFKRHGRVLDKVPHQEFSSALTKKDISSIMDHPVLLTPTENMDGSKQLQYGEEMLNLFEAISMRSQRAEETMTRETPELEMLVPDEALKHGEQIVKTWTPQVVLPSPDKHGGISSVKLAAAAERGSTKRASDYESSAVFAFVRQNSVLRRRGSTKSSTSSASVTIKVETTTITTATSTAPAEYKNKNIFGLVRRKSLILRQTLSRSASFLKRNNGSQSSIPSSEAGEIAHRTSCPQYNPTFEAVLPTTVEIDTPALSRKVSIAATLFLENTASDDNEGESKIIEPGDLHKALSTPKGKHQVPSPASAWSSSTNSPSSTISMPKHLQKRPGGSKWNLFYDDCVKKPFESTINIGFITPRNLSQGTSENMDAITSPSPGTSTWMLATPTHQSSAWTLATPSHRSSAYTLNMPYEKSPEEDKRVFEYSNPVTSTSSLSSEPLWTKMRGTIWETDSPNGLNSPTKARSGNVSPGNCSKNVTPSVGTARDVDEDGGDIDDDQQTGGMVGNTVEAALGDMIMPKGLSKALGLTGSDASPRRDNNGVDVDIVAKLIRENKLQRDRLAGRANLVTGDWGASGRAKE